MQQTTAMLMVLVLSVLLSHPAYSMRLAAFPENRENCALRSDNIPKIWKVYIGSVLRISLQPCIVQPRNLHWVLSHLTSHLSTVSKSCEVMDEDRTSAPAAGWVLTAPCGRISFSAWKGEYLWGILAPSTMTVNLTMFDLHLDCSWYCYFQSFTVYRVDQLHSQYRILLGPVCCSPPPKAVYSDSSYILLVLRLHQTSARQAYLQLLYQFHDKGLAITIRPPVKVQSNVGAVSWIQPSIMYNHMYVHQILISTDWGKGNRYPAALRLDIVIKQNCSLNSSTKLSVYDGPAEFSPMLFSDCPS